MNGFTETGSTSSTEPGAAANLATASCEWSFPISGRTGPCFSTRISCIGTALRALRHLDKVTGAGKMVITLSFTSRVTPIFREVLRNTKVAYDATVDFGRGQNTWLGWSDPL